MIILIDGRSGSGKTELATLMAESLEDATLVRLDDLYPGWDGLDAGSAAVPALITSRRWQAWDWQRDAPGRVCDVPLAGTLIVEGVGAISAASRPLSDVAIWVELDDVTRRRRALERDGATYEPYWDRWAQQELNFISREDPKSLADVVVSNQPVSAER